MLKKIGKTILEYACLIGIAFVIVYLLNIFVVRTYTVNGSSMYPTLFDGDKAYGFVVTKNMGINRFDIVVIEMDKEEGTERLVKRVIGLPGETIEYKDNVLYVNGVETEEDFLTEGVNTTNFKVTLGEDEYYCLGDNREHSSDSRYYGPFSSEQILSTHLFVIGNFSDGFDLNNLSNIFSNFGYKN